jgi:D-glycero-D-manno-heptose 1,7-bisphosphate phosphatase
VALSRVTSQAAAGRHQVVRAVFLDRDGVINANIMRDGKAVAPVTLDQFRILPGVEDAATRLKAAGFLLIVVTNQPDVSTGRTPRDTVEAMHAEIRRRMPIDEFNACFHVDAENCDCRKPKPGMIIGAAKRHGIDLSASFVVGDRWRDIEAGRTAGCTTIYVDYGIEQDGPLHPDKVVRSLAEAADYILSRG